MARLVGLIFDIGQVAVRLGQHIFHLARGNVLGPCQRDNQSNDQMFGFHHQLLVQSPRVFPAPARATIPPHQPRVKRSSEILLLRVFDYISRQRIQHEIARRELSFKHDYLTA